jgi:hypothetical protein
MKPIMNINDLNTIEQLEQFLTGSQPVAFLVASSKDECYLSIQRTLVKFRYPSLNKRSKGVVVRFLVKITGYSRQQITRLASHLGGACFLLTGSQTYAFTCFRTRTGYSSLPRFISVGGNF